MKYPTKMWLPLLGSFLLLWLSNPVFPDDLKGELFRVESDNLASQMIPPAAPDLGGGMASASPQMLTTEREINRGGALLRSLVLPGWGEYYLGYKGTGRLFIAAEVLLWASVIGFETYSQWKEDQFIAFAAEHAGAQMDGKSDDFYADLGNYASTDAYNETKLRNRDYDALYTDPSYFWAWDSDQNRLDYDHTRIESRSAHNKIYFFIGAAALNRLISFIDTGKKATNLQRRKKAPQLGFQVQPESLGNTGAIRLVVSAEF
jgi:hypothetical protein